MDMVTYQVYTFCLADYKVNILLKNDGNSKVTFINELITAFKNVIFNKH